VQHPEIQYINIYAQAGVPRLGCFQDITDLDEEDSDSTNDEQSGGYFYGDATAYEQHLDKVLKQLQQGSQPAAPEQQYYNQYKPAESSYVEANQQQQQLVLQQYSQNILQYLR